MEGGNAFDAAIACAAVECVTMPARCGIGGEAFAILYDATSNKTYGLTSTGSAPDRAFPDTYKNMGYTFVPFSGPLSVSPPGEIAAYSQINETFGTMPLSKLLESAIEYAEEGFRILPGIGRDFLNGSTRLVEFPSTKSTFLNNEKPYKPGDLFSNKNLATTLRRISNGGMKEFYKGDLAKDIVREFQEAGGLIDEEAMANVRAELYEPLSTTYRDYVIAENRPPSQGAILLEMLNIIEGYNPSTIGFLSSEGIHLMIEAKKLAFADRNKYLGDPLFENIPLEMLISKEFAKDRRSLININQATSVVEPSDLVSLGTDTSYFCVSDIDGNAISFIHSIYAPWGSAFVAGDTGILFNNRQRGFHIEKGHANTMSPRKRPMHTLNAYMVLKNNKPFLIGGTPGADLQVQSNLQTITAIIDHGIKPEDIVKSPRWYSRPGSDPESSDDMFDVLLEKEMPAEVWNRLTTLGHTVKQWPNSVNSGLIQLIQIDHTSGEMKGVSDPRGDGEPKGL
jgi:gamma-glutamyltranspeptidase/glutathione hydrolase